MNNWRKFRRLARRERRLFIHSLLLLPLNGMALRLISFKRLQSILTHLARFNRVSEDIPPETQIRNARTTARMLRAAALYGPYHAKCLPQSLTLWWLLLRQGIKSDLRFGARKEAGRLEAHAWVELNGLPLNDNVDIDQRFAPFEHSVTRAEGNS